MKLLSLLCILYSILSPTPSLKQKKVFADGKITSTLLPITLKTLLTSEKKLSCKEFLENAGKTYQRQYFLNDVLIMLQIFLKNYD